MGSDCQVRMQGEGVPREKEKGIECSLGFSAMIMSISIDFRGLGRKLGYGKENSISKTHRILAFEGNLRIILFYR